MAQLGSDEKPVMFRKAIVSKNSRFRKNFDKKKYDKNYDRIFNKEKTYSEAMQQEDSEPINDMLANQRRLGGK
jgi:pyruvate/2-oxoacid:ferredoxin oxidoreductase beta subunit